MSDDGARPKPAELAVLAGLAASRGDASVAELLGALDRSGLAPSDANGALERVVARGQVELAGSALHLTSAGSTVLLEAYAAIEAALDSSPSTRTQEDCPSIPWLTQVQTEWIEAVSINYAVDPDAVAALVPAPLEPEVFEGSAWVQVLMSSLRDMRPQGLGALFGVNFYQVSYRAAVRYRDADGRWRRGGYFVRSETNHEVMRAVGNTLAEFRFHAFGAAEMYLLRDGDRLTAAIDSEDAGGKLVGVFDTRPLDGPPPGSVWRDLDHLEHPLVECYDAFGVDDENGWLYTLTIDRDPWNASFVRPIELYCEYAETAPLQGAARLDSVLHIPRCAYRWRPLRRAPLAR